LLCRLRCHPLPGFVARMRSSDSLVSIGLGSGLPLPSAYLRAGATFLRGLSARPRRARARGARLLGDGLPAPRCSGFSRERRGSPRLLGRPLRTCRGHIPRRRLALSPDFECVAVAFRRKHSLGTGMFTISGLDCRGPHVRVPTHRQLRCLRCRKARYRPGGLLPGRTGFAPAGRLTEFRGYRISPLLSDQPCLVARFPRIPRAGAPRGMQPVMPRSAARTARDERADRERLPARQVPP
jgi:hypothetical protein